MEGVQPESLRVASGPRVSDAAVHRNLLRTAVWSVMFKSVLNNAEPKESVLSCLVYLGRPCIRRRPALLATGLCPNQTCASG